MSNNEVILNDLDYLKQVGVNVKVYHDLQDANSFILEANGTKANFNAKELKAYLEALKNNVDDIEEQEAKKRRMFRSMLLEASEELARKYNKQVYTLSIGDIEK